MDIRKGFHSFTGTQLSRPVSPISTDSRPRSTFRHARTGHRSSATTKSSGDEQAHMRALSCVTRATMQEDCARQRFIVWAAVKRNLSKRIEPYEKLCCPLSRCRQQFQDHESMLRHLADCEQLPSGEYWCYEHDRIEKFDDVKCKHCLGHPSKRRKVFFMAKNFFHSLGHKSKRETQTSSPGSELTFLPPPSYDMISLAPPMANVTELPADQIVEADSKEIWSLPSMSSDCVVINPQALLVPSVPELGCSNQLLPPIIPLAQAHDTQVPGMPWNALAADVDMNNTSSRPPLQLNIFGLSSHDGEQFAPTKQVAASSRSKNLSPSSSFRSSTSTNSNTSNSTSLISSESNSSDAWSHGSSLGTGLTSPVDLDLPEDLFENTSGSSKISSEPNYIHHFYSELPADVPDTMGMGDISSDHLLLSLDGPASTYPPYAQDITMDTDFELTDTVEANEKANYSEPSFRIQSACEALKAHVEESSSKIQQATDKRLSKQPVVTLLRAMTTRSVASAGLRTLRALLDGKRPASAVDALCFVHLSYALSMVTFEQHTKELSASHFQQSLLYEFDIPQIERDVYRQLVFLIWKPPQAQPHLKPRLDLSLKAQGKTPDPDLGSGTKLSGDTLLETAMSFLDKLEISLVLQERPSLPNEVSSDLYQRHVSQGNPNMMRTPFPMLATMAIQQLQHHYAHCESLATRLMAVQQKLHQNNLASVRRLEIELIQAGADCMDTLRYYGQFVPDVRMLCDEIYQDNIPGTTPRLAFYNDAVSLIEDTLSLPMICSDSTVVSDGEDDLQEFGERLNASYPQSQSLSQSPQRGTSDTDPLMTDSLPDGLRIDLYGMPNLQQLDQALEDLISLGPAVPSNSSSAASPILLKTEALPSNASPFQQHTTPPAPEDSSKSTQIPASFSCTLCDYRPHGDPKWFSGSMQKHMKLKHSEGPEIFYKCPYPGCTSKYRNRPDNLRQHQIEKGHFVPGDGGEGDGDGSGSENRGGRRGSRKRRKIGGGTATASGSSEEE